MKINAKGKTLERARRKAKGLKEAGKDVPMPASCRNARRSVSAPEKQCKKISAVFAGLPLLAFVFISLVLPSVSDAGCLKPAPPLYFGESLVGDCSDITPPDIGELKLSSGTFKIGDTIDLSLQVKDSESGVRNVYVFAYRSDWNKSWIVYLSSSSAAGVWSAKRTIGQNEAGTWSVTYVTAYDYASNSSWKSYSLYNSTLSYKVEDPNSDVTPPQIIRVTMSSGTFKTGDKIDITVNAQDSGTGVKNIYALVYRQDWSKYWYCYLSYNSQTGLWAGNRTIEDNEAGKWYLTSVNAYDNASNSAWKSYSIYQSSLCYTVNDPDSDVTAPEIRSMAVSTGILKIGDSLKIYADVQDTGSGVKNVWVQSYRSQGNRYWSVALASNSQSGLWEGSRTIGPDDGGKWAVNFVNTYDFAKNYSWKSGTPSYVVDCSIKECADPVGDLSAAALQGRKIQLTWAFSPTASVTSYKIYMGTTSVNLASPVATLLPYTEHWSAENLTADVTYRFVVHAVHLSGCEEQNTNTVSATALDSTPACSGAKIKSPQNGKKVSGNRVTILGEIDCEPVKTVKSVRFEYRSSMENDEWKLISAANKEHPNPDTSSPYFVHWDVTEMPNGDYQLRAVTVYDQGDADPSPSFITVQIDNENPDVVEHDSGNDQQERTEKIQNHKNNLIVVSDPKSKLAAQIQIPAGALTLQDATATIKLNPDNAPKPDKSLKSAGSQIEITLRHGQSQLKNEAILILPYLDQNTDGIVDGTDIRETELEPYYYNPAKKAWEKMAKSGQERGAISRIDTHRKTVLVKTNHFSLFGLFAAQSDGYNETFRLEEVYAFPNPARNGRNPTIHMETGSADRIELGFYTLSGELVHSAVVSETPQLIAGSYANEYLWDVSGMASGVYVVSVNAVKQGERTRKKLIKVGVVK